MKAQIYDGSIPEVEQQELPLFLKKSRKGDATPIFLHIVLVSAKGLEIGNGEIGRVLILFVLIVSVAWWPMALGSLLVVLAAFWPHSKSDTAKGSGAVSATGFKINMNGSLRIGVLIAGLLVLGFTLYGKTQFNETRQMNSPPASLGIP